MIVWASTATTAVAAAPPNRTSLGAWSAKPAPRMVTAVPPMKGPVGGSIAVTWTGLAGAEPPPPPPHAARAVHSRPARIHAAWPPRMRAFGSRWEFIVELVGRNLRGIAGAPSTRLTGGAGHGGTQSEDRARGI